MERVAQDHWIQIGVERRADKRCRYPTRSLFQTTRVLGRVLELNQDSASPNCQTRKLAKANRRDVRFHNQDTKRVRDVRQTRRPTHPIDRHGRG